MSGGKSKSFAALIALIAGLFLASAATAQPLVMVTDRVGSTNNAIGTGFAKIATEYSPQRIIVRAFAGPDAYMTKLNSGEYQLSVMSSMTAWFEYNGKFGKRGKMSNLRLLSAGQGAVKLTFVVPEKSDIKTIKDLKGHKVTYGFGGHPAVGLVMTGTLATAGLTWDDVVKVPVTGVVAGIRALSSGRAEASWTSYAMPALQEVNAKMGIRYLSLINTPEAHKYYREDVYPGLRFVTLKANPKVGLATDTTFMTYDTYVAVNKDVDAKTVKEVLDAIWAHTPELREMHYGLKGFTHEAAATDLPMIPYHPAAIEFYKEKGVWTPAVEKANAALQ